MRQNERSKWLLCKNAVRQKLTLHGEKHERPAHSFMVMIRVRARARVRVRVMVRFRVIRNGDKHFMYNLSCILSAHFLEILSPGHLMSGHQTSSSDPNS